MLHTASLPPSMAKREKIKPKPIICPRSFKSLDDESDFNYPVKSHSIPNYKASHEKLEQELKDLKGDFITTSPLPFKLKTARRSAERRVCIWYFNRKLFILYFGYSNWPKYFY